MEGPPYVEQGHDFPVTKKKEVREDQKKNGGFN